MGDHQFIEPTSYPGRWACTCASHFGRTARPQHSRGQAWAGWYRHAHGGRQPTTPAVREQAAPSTGDET